MHKNFGEWYRLVSIEPTDEILKMRWAGVEEWASSIRAEDEPLLETVRIFRGLPEKTSREAFFTAFRNHDAAFAQRSNNLEQRVLAGATLVQCVLTSRDTKEDEGGGVRAAIIAGTAVEASRLRASDETLTELTSEMRGGLHQIARQQRSRRSFSTVLLPAREEEALIKTLEQVTNSPDHAQLRTHVGAAFQTILKAVRRSESALEGAAHDLHCADEESNILWWLAGGNSRDLNKPWSALKEAAPLIAGWELADLTGFPLSLQDAIALLERVIPETKGKRKEQPLHAYVNAAPDDWARVRTAKLTERAIDLAPLSFALSCRSKSPTTWQAFFESNSGLEASIKLTAEQVARLAYVEAMLFSTLAKTDD